MSVYRRTYIDRHGKRQKVSTWAVEVSDHAGKPFAVPGYPDKAASRALEQKLRQLVAVRATGAAPDRALREWLDGIAPRLRDNLARRGILTGQQVAALRPLADLIESWRAHMESDGLTQRHVRESVAKARRVLDGIGAKFWTQIDTSAIERHLLERRREGLSIQTSNHHLAAMRAFCNWAVEAGLVPSNPLNAIRPGNAAEDRRLERLPLTAAQYGHLLSVTAAEPARFGMSGPERALLYRIAAETGYRRSELLALRVADIDTSDPKGAVLRLSAAATKNRKHAGQPLRPEALALLQAHVATKLPIAPIFGVGRCLRTAACLRTDLAAAGIPDTDGTGRSIDFHALRMTFNTLMREAGVDLDTRRELMRHSSSRLTEGPYMMLTPAHRRAGVMALPDVTPAQAVAATGTEGVCRADLRGGSARTFPNVPTSDTSSPDDDGGGGARGTSATPHSEAGGNRSESNRPSGVRPDHTVLKTGGFEPDDAGLMGRHADPVGGARPVVADLDPTRARLLAAWERLDETGREYLLRFAEELAE